MGSVLLKNGSIALRGSGSRARTDCCGCGGGDCVHGAGSYRIYNETRTFPTGNFGALVGALQPYSCCYDPVAVRWSGSVSCVQSGYYTVLDGGGVPRNRAITYNASAVLELRPFGGEQHWHWVGSGLLTEAAVAGFPYVETPVVILERTYRYIGAPLAGVPWDPASPYGPDGPGLAYAMFATGIEMFRRGMGVGAATETHTLAESFSCDRADSYHKITASRPPFLTNTGYSYTWEATGWVEAVDPCPGDACAGGGLARGGGMLDRVMRRLGIRRDPPAGWGG